MASYNQDALINRFEQDDPLQLPKPKNGNTGYTGGIGGSLGTSLGTSIGARTMDFQDKDGDGKDDRGPLGSASGSSLGLGLNSNVLQAAGLTSTGTAGPAIAPPPGSGPSSPSAIGAFGNKLEGFDAGKLSSGHDSPKYQFGRVMSQFDPKGGITQDMLDSLNQLGLGTVSGKVGGDKISVGGNVDPRFNGITEFDVIRDLENGGGWQWDAGAASGAPQGAGPLLPQGNSIGSLLGGSDPLAGIQAAIGQYGGQGENLKALLAQLGI